MNSKVPIIAAAEARARTGVIADTGQTHKCTGAGDALVVAENAGRRGVKRMHSVVSWTALAAHSAEYIRIGGDAGSAE